MIRVLFFGHTAAPANDASTLKGLRAQAGLQVTVLDPGRFHVPGYNLAVRALRRLTTLAASIIFTIPSLALFVVLPLIIPTRILDETNVIVALTLYTTALLVRAVPEALDAVPAYVRDAAAAVGYTRIGQLVKVDLPLSIPVLIAGLRVVAVTNISMVAVGSVIGIGGLGTWFTEGYQADKSDQIVAGIIAIFVLAVIIDVLILAAGRLITPWARKTKAAA